MFKHFICDLDGTLVDHSQRLHLAPKRFGSDEEWDEFNKRSLDDIYIEGAVTTFSSLAANAGRTFLLTARSEKHREITMKKVKLHSKINRVFSQLIMRPHNTYIHDTALWKLHMLKALGVSQKSSVIMDDSDSVVRLLRDEGYFVLQPQSNSF